MLYNVYICILYNMFLFAGPFESAGNDEAFDHSVRSSVQGSGKQ